MQEAQYVSHSDSAAALWQSSNGGGMLEIQEASHNTNFFLLSIWHTFTTELKNKTNDAIFETTGFRLGC
jgi:hypothetical protein